MNENVYYIIVNDNFPTQVTYKHTSFDSAEREAQRLARKCKGEKFVIMRAIKSYQINEFIVNEYVESCDNPDDPEYVPF